MKTFSCFRCAVLQQKGLRCISPPTLSSTVLTWLGRLFSLGSQPSHKALCHRWRSTPSCCQTGGSGPPPAPSRTYGGTGLQARKRPCLRPCSSFPVESEMCPQKPPSQRLNLKFTIQNESLLPLWGHVWLEFPPKKLQIWKRLSLLCGSIFFYPLW